MISMKSRTSFIIFLLKKLEKLEITSVFNDKI